LLLRVAACSSASDDDRIRVEVQQLTLARGEAASQGADRLAKAGRRAIPAIEAALHTADAPGRKNLILALRRIGDVEAVPLLQHIATWDAESDVRREATWTLKGWATGDGERAVKAREALRKLDESHAREEAG
jgi:hypothetical protein